MRKSIAPSNNRDRQLRPPRPQSLFDSLESRTLLSVQLVADINPAPGSSNPAQVLTHNGLTYFTANDNAHGTELWRTDGTSDGTLLIRDFTPGADSSTIVSVGAAGKWAYFLVNFTDLWKTDGTVANTIDLSTVAGLISFPGAKPQAATARGTDLFFTTDKGLYRAPEQQLIPNQVATLPVATGPLKMVTAGQKIYFLNSDRNIWVSDGTASGTKVVVNGATGGTIIDIAAVGDILFFTRSGDLWKTQGDAASTVLVKDLPANRSPSSLASVGNTLYFAAGDFFFGALWKSDGTADGTVEVKAGSPTASFPLPNYLTPAGNRLYFTDNSSFGAVWVSDGTADGTMKISGDVKMVSRSGLHPPLLPIGDQLYFQGQDTAHGAELWTSDGIATAPTLVADLVPGAASANPQVLAVLNGKLLFVPTLPDVGSEFWTTDGSAANTTLLKDINAGTESARPGKALGINGKALFTATAADGNVRLFAIPTSGAAPEMLMIDDGSLPSAVGNLTLADDRVYFTAKAFGNTIDTQLFVTDGTSTGTHLVKSLAGLNNPTNFYAVGSRLFFTAGNVNAATLYTTDGTSGDVVPLAASLSVFSTSSNSPDTRLFLPFQGRLYFSAGTGSGPVQLWSSDGTTAGTGTVTQFTADPNGANVNWLTPLGDRLYFLARGGKVYQTDGTPAGTTLLTAAGTASRLEVVGDTLLLGVNGISRYKPGDAAPIQILDWSFASSNAVRIGKWIYFQGTRSSGGPLFRTDGTAQGTVQLTDVISSPADLTAVGDRLYFTGFTIATGRELWTSDGTPGGTYALDDLIPGRGSSATTNLSQANGTLYFSAIDGLHGAELWRAIDDIPPAPLTATFTPAVRTGSVDVIFTENVGATLKLSDWILTNRATGQDVSNLLTSLTFNPDTDTATLTFASALPDGDYHLSLAAGLATDPAGNASVAPVTFDFFQFAADINHDRAVDFNDLVILAQNYNTTGKTRAAGDLTGDGIVDFNDLVVLAQSYNTTLPTLAPVPAIPAPRPVAPKPKASAANDIKPPLAPRPRARL